MTRTRTEIMPSRMDRGSHEVTEASNVRAVLTAYTGILASVVGVALVLGMPGHWPALAGALLLACVPSGAAVMCWVDTGIGTVQAGLTLVLSLAVTAITSAAMIWLPAWHPKLLFVLAAVSSMSCAMRLSRMRASAITWARPAAGEGLGVQLALLFLGLAAWAYGVSRIRPPSIGAYGLLASANPWFFLGIAALLAGGVLELTRPRQRSWMLSTYLMALILAIYSTAPILFKVPEYAWVYKHIGIIQALGHYGYITDPSNIYQQWPALFAAVASVSRLSQVGPLNFAAWAPLAFELADALLLLGIFRMLAGERRVVYVAMFIYEGFIAWVGQDYLSPQAFGYLLWLGILTILIRWMLAPPIGHANLSILSRLRAPFLAELGKPKEVPVTQRTFALVVILITYFAIVAAHQLTPYMVLIGIGTLASLGLLRRGWILVIMLAVVAVGYLVPHYGLISQQFGGIFSGGNALANASGKSGVIHSYGAELFTAKIVRALAIGMWLLTLAVVARQWRRLGRVVIPAVLAFSPFILIFVQNYGGEAIYRVFLFSSPWCAFLIAGELVKIRAVAWRWLAVTCACSIALAAGLQGQYGPTMVDGFTRAELTASLWLYGHARPGSSLILAADNFPALEVANYNSYNLDVIPADPQEGGGWLTEANAAEVDRYIASLGNHPAYVVLSRSMAAYTNYFGGPHGYARMASAVSRRPEWVVIYRNADTTIYQVKLNKRITQAKSS